MSSSNENIDSPINTYQLYLMYNEESRLIKIGMCKTGNLEKRQGLNSGKLAMKIT
jgi:hypothetical protein